MLFHVSKLASLRLSGQQRTAGSRAVYAQDVVVADTLRTPCEHHANTMRTPCELGGAAAHKSCKLGVWRRWSFLEHATDTARTRHALLVLMRFT
jgi:hypothetical protein